MEKELDSKATDLLCALKVGDVRKAREMLRGEDALEVALTFARRDTTYVLIQLGELLNILAAERAATKAFAQATGGAKPPSYYEVPPTSRGPELNPSFDDKLLQMTAEYSRRRLAEHFKDSSTLSAVEGTPLRATDEDVETRR